MMWGELIYKLGFSTKTASCSMPRYILLVFAVLILASWAVAFAGPADARDSFFGFARGATIGTVVFVALAELGTWLNRRGRA